tara:strand:- start:991 stop:1254 length:264 start_codon:yes stop_codon:yes gene_type:complete
MNKRNVRLVKKIEEILGDKEFNSFEILQQLKELEGDRKKNKWHMSFTPNQVYNLLKRKQFEKVGFNKKANQTIWRNKNVMDREIQAE